MVEMSKKILSFEGIKISQVNVVEERSKVKNNLIYFFWNRIVQRVENKCKASCNYKYLVFERSNSGIKLLKLRCLDSIGIGEWPFEEYEHVNSDIENSTFNFVLTSFCSMEQVDNIAIDIVIRELRNRREVSHGNALS